MRWGSFAGGLSQGAMQGLQLYKTARDLSQQRAYEEELAANAANQAGLQQNYGYEVRDTQGNVVGYVPTEEAAREYTTSPDYRVAPDRVPYQEETYGAQMRQQRGLDDRYNADLADTSAQQRVADWNAGQYDRAAQIAAKYGKTSEAAAYSNLGLAPMQRQYLQGQLEGQGLERTAKELAIDEAKRKTEQSKLFSEIAQNSSTPKQLADYFSRSTGRNIGVFDSKDGNTYIIEDINQDGVINEADRKAGAIVHDMHKTGTWEDHLPELAARVSPEFAQTFLMERTKFGHQAKLKREELASAEKIAGMKVKALADRAAKAAKEGKVYVAQDGQRIEPDAESATGWSYVGTGEEYSGKPLLVSSKDTPQIAEKDKLAAATGLVDKFVTNPKTGKPFTLDEAYAWVEASAQGGKKAQPIRSLKDIIFGGAPAEATPARGTPDGNRLYGSNTIPAATLEKGLMDLAAKGEIPLAQAEAIKKQREQEQLYGSVFGGLR